MIKAYQEGMGAFENKLYLDAAKKFNEAEILFPQSEWAPRSALMAAYAYFYDDYNNRAISELINFFKSILFQLIGTIIIKIFIKTINF